MSGVIHLLLPSLVVPSVAPKNLDSYCYSSDRDSTGPGRIEDDECQCKAALHACMYVCEGKILLNRGPACGAQDPIPGHTPVIPFTKAADPARHHEVAARAPPPRVPFAQRLPDTLRNHFVAMLGEYVGTVLFLWMALAGTQVSLRLG